MSAALQAYASGLLAFMLIKILAPGYFARQDTRTPVRIGIQAMVVNMVFNLILVLPLAHVGLALATAISSYFNALMLYLGLRKAGVLQHQSGWPGFIAKLALANAALLGTILWLMGAAADWLLWSATERMLQMALVVAAGVVVYVLVLLMAGLRPRHVRGALFD
jgi:putative peptidoglycan lipid II flippase